MKKKDTKKRKVQVEVPASLMRSLVAYLFSGHQSRGFIKKMRIFFHIIDDFPFTEDPDLEVYHAIVVEYSNMYVEEGVTNSEMILDKLVSHARLGEEIEDVLNDISDMDLTEKDATYIENEIISRLNYANAVPHIAAMKQAIQRYEKNDFSDFNDIIEAIRHQTTSFNRSLTTKSGSVLSIPEIDFNSREFDNILDKVYKSLTNEKRFVRAGIKRLNAMLQGGFQPGRLYVFMAVSGGFKSGLLLQVFLWAAKYNAQIRCRDQARKPLFIYISRWEPVAVRWPRKLF